MAYNADNYTIATPQYDDLQVTLGEIKLPGVSDPGWQAYKGGYVLSFSASADNIISFTAQLPHSWKCATDIEFHIHTVYPDANSGNSIWNFTHSWVGLNGEFPTETPVSDVVLAAPESANTHRLQEIAATIDGSGITNVSSFLICSLQREGSNESDTYASAIYLIGLDFHILKDSVGSASIASK